VSVLDGKQLILCGVFVVDQWCSTVQARDYVNLISTLYPKVLAGRQNDYWITDDDPRPRKKTVKKNEKPLADLDDMEPLVMPSREEVAGPVDDHPPTPPPPVKPKPPSPKPQVEVASLPSSRSSDDGGGGKPPKKSPPRKRGNRGSPEKKQHHLE
jgi:hypothetical protein